MRRLASHPTMRATSFASWERVLGIRFSLSSSSPHYTGRGTSCEKRVDKSVVPPKKASTVEPSLIPDVTINSSKSHRKTGKVGELFCARLYFSPLVEKFNYFQFQETSRDSFFFI